MHENGSFRMELYELEVISGKTRAIQIAKRGFDDNSEILFISGTDLDGNGKTAIAILFGKTE